MTLSDLARKLELKVLAGARGLDREVTGGYTGDLISDVMANSQKGQVWITLQGHINVVAVGTLRELAGVVLINNRTPAQDALTKAEEEGWPMLQSDLPAFELSGRLYALLSG
ncbi:MAG: serine kinase [Thermodesulfobacteriota bacterium]